MSSILRGEKDCGSRLELQHSAILDHEVSLGTEGIHGRAKDGKSLGPSQAYIVSPGVPNHKREMNSILFKPLFLSSLSNNSNRNSSS